MIGGAAVLLLMEACRRVVGIPIVLIASLFMLIGFLGRQMPGFLSNRGFSALQIVKHLFYTQEGLFGAPIGASSTFIFLFILFGACLEKTGVGEFFIDLSNSSPATARRARQGAVITSALRARCRAPASPTRWVPLHHPHDVCWATGRVSAAVEAAASIGGRSCPR